MTTATNEQQKQMTDYEFHARLQVVLNNLMPGVGRLEVDLGNLNELCMEHERRARKVGVKYDSKVKNYVEN